MSAHKMSFRQDLCDRRRKPRIIPTRRKLRTAPTEINLVWRTQRFSNVSLDGSVCAVCRQLHVILCEWKFIIGFRLLICYLLNFVLHQCFVVTLATATYANYTNEKKNQFHLWLYGLPFVRYFCRSKNDPAVDTLTSHIGTKTTPLAAHCSTWKLVNTTEHKGDEAENGICFKNLMFSRKELTHYCRTQHTTSLPMAVYWIHDILDCTLLSSCIYLLLLYHSLFPLSSCPLSSCPLSTTCWTTDGFEWWDSHGTVFVRDILAPPTAVILHGRIHARMETFFAR